MCSTFVVMKPPNEIGCPEMILLFIPVILYGIWYNWSEKQKEVKRQNRDRERNNISPRRGSEPIERKLPPIINTPVSPVVVPEVPASIVNIATDPTDTSWFLCTHKDLPAPSAAESLIIEQLEMYDVKWYREVSFKGLQFTLYSWPRYDFYLPSINTIIEYDGRSSHSNDVQIATDIAKNKFCNDNGITIVRYNAKHYYNMCGHINSLMKQSGIKKKTLQPKKI